MDANGRYGLPGPIREELAGKGVSAEFFLLGHLVQESIEVLFEGDVGVGCTGPFFPRIADDLPRDVIFAGNSEVIDATAFVSMGSHVFNVTDEETEGKEERL